MSRPVSYPATTRGVSPGGGGISARTGASREHAGPASESETSTELLVIGGGINGTAIAREAALRGFRVLLVEQGDLGQGTSSWSSRLIHGGIRYLEHGEFRLVRESLRERELLLRHAPHLVHAYPLLIPFYEHNKRSSALLRTGMLTYDLLSWDKSTPWHRTVRRSQLRDRWSGLEQRGLAGGAVYHDAQSPWAERLCVENALSAREVGAQIRTHTRVHRLIREGGRVSGAVCRDGHTGAEYPVRAGTTINATGPWIDALLEDQVPDDQLVGGTKGSHIVVDPFPGAPPTGVHYEARGDGRAVLVLPWAGRYLIGATDLYYDGDPGTVSANDAEIDYLLSETNKLIPSAGLSYSDVLYSYCGVRPLPRSPEAGSEANVSRDHIIHDHGPDASGLLSIIGGKLTTHRALAEQTMDKVSRSRGFSPRRSPTRQLALPGARTVDWQAFRAWFVRESRFAADTAERLLDIYGTRATNVDEMARQDPTLATEFAPNAVAAELVHAFENEQARELSDALLRRTMVGLGDVGLDAVEPATEVLRRHLGMEPDRASYQAERYRQQIQRLRPSPAVTVRS